MIDKQARCAIIVIMSVEIVFVLVGTTHSGNLGAAARAIKVMGFNKMRLVDTCSHRTAEAIARSSGANDILEHAVCYDSLDEAVADCVAVVGTSARSRNLSVPMRSCRDTAEEIADSARASDDRQTVAMVFGHERSGLSNESLDRCTRLLRIPCNPDFSSLNLGSAVQVVAYELSQALESVPLGAPQRMAGKWKPVSDEADGQTQDALASKQAGAATESSAAEPPATSEQMQHFFEHLDRVMISTGFLDPDNPRYLRRRLRRYFESNRPSEDELSIFRGILTSVENPRPR